jgi:hypothetical protein
MDIERPVKEGSTQKPDEELQQESSSKAGRLPPHCANLHNHQSNEIAEAIQRVCCRQFRVPQH